MRIKTASTSTEQRFNHITDNIGCQKIFEEDIPRRKIPPRLESKLKSKLAVYNFLGIIHLDINSIVHLFFVN